MEAITTIDKIGDVLIKHIKECDGDELLAIFDYVFGTDCYIDEDEKIVVRPGKEDEYGGIIEEEFKEDIIA